MMGKRRRRTSSSSATTSSSATSSSSSSSSTTFDQSNPQHLFAVTLAALSNHEIGKPTSEANLLIRKALDRLLFSLLSKSPNSIMQTLHAPLISLLPVLITSKCSEIACSSLEIVGTASLFSIEMNEQIAFDDEIVKGLITAVASSRRNVSMAACNALLDLFTTSVGRCKLLEHSAIDNLIFCFLQVPKSSTPSVSLVMEQLDGKTFFTIGFTEDEYIISLLHIVIILINDCTLDQLRKIPRGLANNLLTYLAKLWAQVHKHIIIDTVQESEKRFYLSNIRTNNLAESLFRLSMERTFTQPSNFQEVKTSIFHDNFESFIVNHWEKSPLLIKNVSNTSLRDNVFSTFSQFLKSKDTVSSFLECLLQNLSSAIPIGSDELDIISFLNEARENIGCPLIYQQDIRVVKTSDSKREKHFFRGFDVPYILNARDISRCEEAYNDGYTFALRGMEFRLKDIAAVSEQLTSLFGQPSTGVNMYLTPPKSQGLARHRDDHCVVVCQIRGVKRWRIFPNPCPRLPRLYENVDYNFEGENGNEKIDGCKEFLLREGDVLYIPRGFPHEACTVTNDDETNGNAEFSLHLTLAIEIEPPFEWEGFVHVALHHWGDTCNLSSRISRDSSSHDLDDMIMHLMHIAIKLIGNIDPTCRKACLAGAISYPLVTEDFLQTHQRSTFNHLLSIINSSSNFNDVYSNLEVAIRKNEDLFENLRWVRHLDQKMSSIAMEDLFHVVVHQKDKVEAAFMEAKSKFCNEVVFDDVVHRYSMLLGKYRSMRKRYMNGMLALSCV
ncbi:putative [histone H3]-dimethyl-L-lysine(36) demethylase [Helianthus annuus]|uniref:Bifunctional lysine-specific demethylase and histidyl-hydroxylase n=1 Tax=Helianthus annuus TaxID=4232 RepID=A0A251TS95_HELAN|nr:uncharacterized protein LOC110877482 [Helianthus annuus]KAF5789547.1 putative [histone H3]-lysine-36 demethylase [Helianthus annuus]KAJ0532880.1 putative [histone H3]-dimethyl-L-lysine(36) demethylase [Helianthus annuus]KAJ0541281.1 putative [histone H3]-dimethyl-L-lysine(36) demethylase [Helianthus annuus]KAJ0706362.1 putative [histone H3]-dimethyl-L-lysine(36) demethylase [Helianthus annuus]KAJ0886884.1 putative [histone H3]-dimethyl-L-lysine(36) demethylase [Helianthus annuus]